MKKRGFTLVEILVVLAIIAILMAILLPVLSSVREAGRATSCRSNLRQLGQAIQMYAQDWERYPRGLDVADKYSPQIWAGHPEAGGTLLADTPLLNIVLEPYVKNKNVWACASDSGYDNDDITGQAIDARPTSFEKFGISYAYRTEITLLNLAEEHLKNPTETNVLNDANGSWHGASLTNGYQGKRYNMLFGDGHVKSVDRAGFNLAWAMPLR